MENMALPIGAEQVCGFTKILEGYKAGKSRTESRIRSSENWWKLRNTQEEKKQVNIGADGGFVHLGLAEQAENQQNRIAQKPGRKIVQRQHRRQERIQKDQT